MNTRQKYFKIIALSFIFIFLVLPPIFTQSNPKAMEILLKERGLIYTLIFIAFLAIYEEALYRVILPETSLSLFENSSPLLLLLIEIVIMLLFATAHLYMGLTAFFYALGMGAIFRLIYRRISNKVLGFLVITTIHIANNFLVLWLNLL